MRPILLLLLTLGCAPDEDRDGFRGRDCNDKDPQVNPSATEICDGIDNDCDGLTDEEVSITAYWDRDGDGHGSPDHASRVCSMPEDGASEGDDCNDLDALSFPGAEERCDLQDNDCDGEADEGVQLTFYEDADGDGHGTVASTIEACDPPPGFAPASDDCDDTDALAWDGAPEHCDGIDNDCDGEVDEGAPGVQQWTDADGDGYGDPNAPVLACGPVPGVADTPLDCDDTDASTSPDTEEIRGNGVDEDCDGYIDEYAVPTAFQSLAAAVAAAPDGAVVQLGAATLVESIDLTGRALTLAGEGCARSVLYSSGGTTVTLDGGRIESLSISGGTAQEGGGVVVNGDVTLSDVCVTGNTALSAGGGIAVLEGTLTLDDSHIVSNSAYVWGGGVHVGPSGALVARRVTVSDNAVSFDGGGLSVRGGRADVAHAVFARNVAGDQCGAIFVDKVPDPHLVDHWISGTGEFVNLTFHANASDDDGMVACANGATATFNNVLLTGHAAPHVDNELFHFVSSDTLPGVTSSLVVDHLGSSSNTAGELQEHWFVQRAVRGDPAYVGPNDFRLRIGSAMLDRGDPDLMDPDGSRSDLGAYGGPATWPGWEDPRQDRDQDGMLDGWELFHGLHDWRDDSGEDPDADGLPNLAEHLAGSSPHLPDTDADGVDDSAEVAAGTRADDPRDHRPLALPEAEKWVQRHVEVSVDGSASRDPNGDPLTYMWEIASPPGSAVSAVDDPAAATASFTPDIDGRYSLRLTVSDGSGADAAETAVHVFDGLVVPDDVATIGEALELKSGNDAIFLQPGTYTEVIELGSEDLTLIGLGRAEEVVVDAAGSWRPLTAVFNNDVELAHLTLRGGANVAEGGGVFQFGGKFRATDVVVEQNTSRDHGGGLHFETVTAVELDRVWVRANHSALAGGGVYSHDSNLWVVNSQITDNTATTDGGGVYAKSRVGDVFDFRNSVLQGNVGRHGAGMWVRSDSRITNNAFVDNRSLGDADDGALYLRSGEALLFNNIFAYNDTEVVLYSHDDGTPQPLNTLFVEEGPVPFPEWRGESLDPGSLGGVLQQDPGWVLWRNNDVVDDTLAPGPGSPLVDAGFPDFHDPDGSRSDIGPTGGPDAIGDPSYYQLDLDGDGMSDGWELLEGLDPSIDDSGDDPDGDGLSNLDEYSASTNPQAADTDGDGVSDADELAGGTDPNLAADHRPVAEAGDDLRVLVDTPAGLDGSASTDPNGDLLSFSWSFSSVPPGSALLDSDLVDGDTATASFVPDERGVYVVELVVSDGAASSDPDTVMVEVYGEIEVPSTASPTLQAALALALDGDTIVLAAGTYPTSLEDPPVEVTIRGQGAGLTYLEGNRKSTPIIDIATGRTLTLQDLTLTGGSAAYGAAVNCVGSTVHLERVRLSYNAANWGGALRGGGCDFVLTDVDMEGNLSVVSGGAVRVSGGSLSWTRGSCLSNHANSKGGCLYLDSDPDVVLRNLVMGFNTADNEAGGLFQADGSLEVSFSTVIANGGPLAAVFLDGGTARLSHTIFQDNEGFGVYHPLSTPTSDVQSEFNAFFANDDGGTQPPDHEAGAILADAKFARLDRADSYEVDSRLRHDSPCRDAGDPLLLDPDGTTADLGAYGGPDAPDEVLWYADTDSDGLPDGWEIEHALSLGSDDAGEDPDADGLDNASELAAGTDPHAADTDEDGVSDADELTGGSDPTVSEDFRPIAVAGADQLGSIGAAVTVDGVASSDPNGDSLTFSWRFATLPGRSQLTDAAISDETAVAPSFTPDAAGAFVLELVVHDALASSAPDRVTVRVPGELRIPDDYADIQEALDALISGHTLVVGPGTYPARLDLKGKDVVFQGSGPAQTVLDAERRGSVVVAVQGEQLELYDVTLTGGLNDFGGAVQILDGHLEATNAWFVDNSAIYGGAIIVENGSVSLDQARLIENSAAQSGAGIWASAATVDLSRTLAAQNEAPSGYGGAIFSVFTAVTLENVILHDNYAIQGGGVHLSGNSQKRSQLTARFVTATAHSVSFKGSVFRLTHADAVVMSSIFAGNGNHAISLQTTNGPTYSQSYSLWDSTGTYDFGILPKPQSGTDGNLRADALFLAGPDGDGDWSNQDWRLAPGAPGVDAADPLLGADPDSSPPNMGAYGGPLGAWGDVVGW